MNVVIHYYVVTDHQAPVRMLEFQAVRERMRWHAAQVGVPIIEYDSGRPTFHDMLCKNALDDTINVCSNSDCYFTHESLRKIASIGRREAWCLSRWEVDTADDRGECKAVLKTSAGSQDGWVFLGKTHTEYKLDFYAGSRGCDNRVAYILHSSGLTLSNPARSVKLMHYHTSKIRKWLPLVAGPHRHVRVS